jgi:hypothetical protein
MLDAEQRLLTQCCVGPQQAVLPQHVVPALHDPGEPWLPQHDWPALIQYFVPFVPVQQLWPALHETFPQQKLADAEQNFAPPVLVQQSWPALHGTLPQQKPPNEVQTGGFTDVQHDRALRICSHLQV